MGTSMAIEFKEQIEIKPIGTPEVAASRLEAQLDKHFPFPPYVPGLLTLDSTEWRLRDPSNSKSEGASVAEVFKEFREHDLVPHDMFHNRRMPSPKEGERGVLMSVYYRIQSASIYLDIAGTNRMAVDGVAATCQRIKRTLENPNQAVSEASHSTPEPQSPPPSWFSRTWKDHTAQFVLTLVAGVLVVAIGLWLGLSPKP